MGKYSVPESIRQMKPTSPKLAALQNQSRIFGGGLTIRHFLHRRPPKFAERLATIGAGN